MFFGELFSSDNNSKRWDECNITFKNFRQKKPHNFLLHRYQQTGGSLNQGPVNVLRHGQITYYSINFQQHNAFYDFYKESVFDKFFKSVKNIFANAEKGKDYKIQSYFELKNYQRTEVVDLGNTRVWLTNVYTGTFFNDFIRNSVKEDILKGVIVNGSTGSSWLCKRFNRLQIIVTNKSSVKNIFAS